MLPLILSFLVSFLSFKAGECESTPRAPAMYIFGDSQIDPGNNNYIPAHDLARADYSPYGIDYERSIPTGRVSNGKTVADFIAEYLGLPFPPPYLRGDPNPSTTAYNYASAGCGILANTGNQPPLPLNCTPHGRQIDQFEATVNNQLSSIYGGAGQLEQHLADSLFFFWVGSNDYLLSYFQIPEEDAPIGPDAYASLLANTLRAQLERLFRLGARKFVVFEIGPLGCIPFYVDGGDFCVARKNELVDMYNTRLRNAIAYLRFWYKSATFSLGQVNALSKDAFDNPSKYKLSTVNQACCEVAEFLGQKGVQCKKDGQVCGNRDEYLFFDAAHPTQAAYTVLSRECINNASVCSPTIAQLVGGSSHLHSVA